MGHLYCDTGGNATFSGSTDSNSATLSGTGDATVSGSTVTLTALTDLTNVDAVAGSATQSTIYLAQATNSNTKIFWITGKAGSGGATPNVTVSVAPTGVTASNWAIGGRFVLTNASQEAALRAGDTLVFNNSPASQAGVAWTFRNAGDSTSGYAKIVGKTGVRPVLTTSGSGNSVVACGTLSWLENLELKQTHASSGIAMTMNSTGAVAYNVKISQAPGSGIQMNSAGCRLVASEITGVSTNNGNAIASNTTPMLFGCYIHDNTGDGLTVTGTTFVLVVNCIFDTNGGRGINLSGAYGSPAASVVMIIGNTFYANGNSGLEIADADTPAFLANNIFVNNGDAAGEYNVEWVAGTAELVSFHAWNDFFSAGGGGSANLLNLTVNAQVASSEITTDPAMTAPASADFSIPTSSGAFATGYPGQLLGANLGRANMGALQNNGLTPVIILNTSP